MLLIGLSTAIYAEKKSSGSVENKQTNITSITTSDKQKITKDFHQFRKWLITSILPEKDIQTIHKTTRGYSIKSIGELKSNFLELAGIHLMSGDHIYGECNYADLAASVGGILMSINELNNCDKDSCTEENLKDIVEILKMKIESQDEFLPKCYEFGILLKN